MLSESQKKNEASNTRKKFDTISSAVQSTLGRLSNESVTVEVNTGLHCFSMLRPQLKDMCDCRPL